MNRVLLTVLLFYALYASSERLKPIAKSGPYIINIQQLESCEDEGTRQIHFNTRMNSVGGGKYIYNDKVLVNVTVDEDFKFVGEIQQWGNGGWIPKFAKYTFKGCTKIWSLLGKLLTELLVSAGVEDPKCPIPAGNYTLDNFEIKLDLTRMAPTLVYNRYRFVLLFYIGKTKMGCLRVYTDIVPKM